MNCSKTFSGTGTTTSGKERSRLNLSSSLFYKRYYTFSIQKIISMYGGTVHFISSTEQHAYKSKQSCYSVLNNSISGFVQFRCAKGQNNVLFL